MKKNTLICFDGVELKPSQEELQKRITKEKQIYKHLKRRRRNVFMDNLQTESDNINIGNMSDADQPVAKKKRHGKRKKKPSSKTSTINIKNTPRDYDIVNDFLSDEISSNVEDLPITNFKNSLKAPIIKLQTINNSTSRSVTIPNSTLLTKENKDIGFDNFCFLDLNELKLNEYIGYEPDRNIDMSKKILNLKIQGPELKIIKCGGIIPEPSCDTRYEQCKAVVKDIKSTESEIHSYNRNTDVDDDDDVISLFAESISGLETKVRSLPTLSTIAEQNTDNEVFKIPKQVLFNPCNVKNRRGYKFCEKQNADSTSLPMEYPNPGKKLGTAFSAKTLKSNGSVPMEMLCTPITFVKSNLLKGFCIFFLISWCRNNPCTFQHHVPSNSYITSKIVGMTINQLIQEYLMLKNNITLFKWLGLFFLKNCVRRRQSTILVEMAHDFATILGSDYDLQNKKIYIEAMEQTLLYLNNVKLDTLTDLLNMKIKSVLLCEKFLEVIGESQNFSRFKIVFLNLTKLMCSQNKKFNSEVVSNILDRVSILPYSPELSRAVLNMIRRTEVKIVSNSFIKLFAEKLSEYNLALFHEFTDLMGSGDSVSDSHNCSFTENEPQLTDVRYSPDTTNNDRLDEQGIPGPRGLQWNPIPKSQSQDLHRTSPYTAKR